MLLDAVVWKEVGMGVRHRGEASLRLDPTPAAHACPACRHLVYEENNFNYDIMKVELRYASHPNDAKNYDTARLRKEFLIENIFIPDEIILVYSMYDRYMVGGAMPVKKKVLLKQPMN